MIRSEFTVLIIALQWVPHLAADTNIFHTHILSHTQTRVRMREHTHMSVRAHTHIYEHTQTHRQTYVINKIQDE